MAIERTAIAAGVAAIIGVVAGRNALIAANRSAGISRIRTLEIAAVGVATEKTFGTVAAGAQLATFTDWPRMTAAARQREPRASRQQQQRYRPKACFQPLAQRIEGMNLSHDGTIRQFDPPSRPSIVSRYRHQEIFCRCGTEPSIDRGGGAGSVSPSGAGSVRFTPINQRPSRELDR